MNGLEIIDVLTAAEINGGWIIRDGKIVVWENESPVPEALAEFVELD